jgi:hypothetical protein
MDREKPPKNKRLPVTLSPATHDYLASLALEGTHGTSVTDVAKTLIEEGIRQAIQNGFLNRRSAFSSTDNRTTNRPLDHKVDC